MLRFTIRSAPLRHVVLLVLAAFPLGISASEPEAMHPLEVHMARWFEGSGDWRTPNPGYVPPSDPGAEDSGFPEFSVRWRWDPERRLMTGALTGVRPDGSRQLFWNLFAFMNPVSKKMVYVQTGVGGALIQGEQPLRSEPLELGEPESLVTTLYLPDGTVKTTRHDKVFNGDGTHSAEVFEQTDDGWVKARTWLWTLAPPDDAEEDSA